MAEPKLISADGIPAALEKATRYRLLNESLQAESICRDVLAVDPDNQEATVALTDEFVEETAAMLEDARSLLPKIQSEYERKYYEGIINERWGNAQLKKGTQTSIGWFRAAMQCYAKSEELSDPGNDDAVLCWNTCVRTTQRYDFARYNWGQVLTYNLSPSSGSFLTHLNSMSSPPSLISLDETAIAS
jgi:hypothetical protein